MIYDTLSNEQVLVQGIIDLLVVDNDSAQIIDYKYSAHDSEYLRERYALQLDLYRQVVAKVLKINPAKIDCSIVNIRLGFQVDMY